MTNHNCAVCGSNVVVSKWTTHCRVCGCFPTPIGLFNYKMVAMMRALNIRINRLTVVMKPAEFRAKAGE